MAGPVSPAASAIHPGTGGEVGSGMAGLLHNGGDVVDGGLELGCPDAVEPIGDVPALAGSEGHDPGLLGVGQYGEVVSARVVGTG
jgi:hypothetical protein